MGAASRGDCGAFPVVLLFAYSYVAYYSLIIAMITHAGSFVTLYIRYVYIRLRVYGSTCIRVLT